MNSSKLTGLTLKQFVGLALCLIHQIYALNILRTNKLKKSWRQQYRVNLEQKEKTP